MYLGRVLSIFFVAVLPTVFAQAQGAGEQPPSASAQLLLLLSVIIGIVSLPSAFLRLKDLFAARMYVLLQKSAFPSLLRKMEETTRHMYVSEHSRAELATMAKNFPDLSMVHQGKIFLRWRMLRAKIFLETTNLARLRSKMNMEIAHMSTARNEGPELFMKIPTLLDETAELVMAAPHSAEAQRYLADALVGFSRAKDMRAHMTTHEWITLHGMLCDVKANCELAVAALQGTDWGNGPQGDEGFLGAEAAPSPHA